MQPAKQDSKRHENCFICFFRPALFFGWTGVTVLNFHCDHSVRPTKCEFQRSWLATSLSVVLSLAILFVGLHNSYILLGTRVITREDFLFLGTIMINFIAVYLLSVGFRRAQMKVTDLQGIAELTRFGEEMGIRFFDETFVKSGQTLTYALITMFVSLEIITITIFFVLGDFSLNSFKNVCTDTCVFMQGTLGTHYITLHLVKLNMFQKVLDKIKFIAENRLNVSERDDVDSIRSSEQCFEADIRRICRLYSAIYVNFLEDDRFVGPALLIWWNTILSINVVSAYVVLNSIIIQKPLDLVSVSFILKIYGCMVGVIIYLAEMEVTSAVVSSIHL